MSARHPVTEESRACLQWGEGTLPLTGPCVIGRRSDNDLPLNNGQVSRRHALLARLHHAWWLNDLGSRNGTLVNGRRLGSAHRLRDGDEIRIANRCLTYRDPHPPTQETAPEVIVCELIIATAAGEILEGRRAADSFFGDTLEQAPGTPSFFLPPQVRLWLERLNVHDGRGAAPLELQQSGRCVILSFARCTAGRYFLLLQDHGAQSAPNA